MYLKPSEVFYSQDSINNVFDKRCNHRYKPIGETLDELCEGRCSVSDIPTVSVIKREGKWVTADNRRLWVFRQLERLGKCEKIFVHKGNYIPQEKLTSENGGNSVRVRGSPGGYWHRKPSVKKPPVIVNKINTPPAIWQNSSRYGDQFDAVYTQHRGHESYNRNTGGNLSGYQRTPVSGSSLSSARTSQTRAFDASYSSGSNDTRSDFNSRSILSSSTSRNDGFQTRHVPERHVYSHKTYDTSYSEGRSGTSKDNGCCIII